MRLEPISVDNIALLDNWKKRAEAARAAVAAATDKEKPAVINKYRDLWRDMVKSLGALTQDKCWYSEARQVGTDRDIDHFRPKGKIYGTDHQGYWWLAFDITNFRYSCIFCNRRRTDEDTRCTGGKHDRFPLMDESARAKTPYDDMTQEQPALLDPCKAGDPQLLTFAENGEIFPRWAESSRPRAYSRAKVSIETYHLNHTDFVNARVALGRKLQKLIDEADRYFKRLDSATPDMEHAYSEVIRKILECIHPDAEFSAFARTVVQNARDRECLAGIA
jgi:uncharacterized protein (TIGR02646 family)